MRQNKLRVITSTVSGFILACVVTLSANGESSLINLPITPGSESCQLKVFPKTPRVDFFGDVDIMAMESKNQEDKNLIFSLEEISVNSSGGIRAHASFSVRDLKRQTGFSLDFPCPAKASYVGFFICRDTSHSGSCQGKELTKMTAPPPSAMGKPDQLSVQAVPDKVYFFGLGYINSEKKLRVFTELDPRMTLINIEQKLQSITPAMSSSKEMSRLIYKHISTLTSLPPVVGGQLLVIKLPRAATLP